MSTGRTLPKKTNPLLTPENTPSHAELVGRRRLGQTNLQAKPGTVGTHNATKTEHLGLFDYAHLRAPLPANLKSSEIFAPHPKQPHPEAYFLMRRSSDGRVSATGMFKVSFPWAKIAEEQAEREYLHTLPDTSADEVAGNVWISEAFALQLAEEYGIVPWIKALLDDTPVPADDKKAISPPPKFVFTANGEKPSLPPPSATPHRGRGRPRASSPSKKSVTGAMSPRKQRVSKAARNDANAAATREASAALQSTLDSASHADTESVVSVDGDKVTVEVDSAVEVNGDTETTHTVVRVEMPAHSPDLPLPESTEEMIAKAKEMVEEAMKLEGESSKKSSSKRKAEELDVDDEEDEEKDQQLQPAKKARLLEQEVRKQKVRQRALIGVAATLALGAIMPFVLGA